MLDDLVSKIVDDDQSTLGYANGSLSSDSSHESRANSDMFSYDRLFQFFDTVFRNEEDPHIFLKKHTF